MINGSSSATGGQAGRVRINFCVDSLMKKPGNRLAFLFLNIKKRENALFEGCFE